MKALCLLLLLAPILPVAAEDTAGSRPRSPSLSKKVWTTEDVRALREKGLISLIGQESQALVPVDQENGPAETAVAGRPRAPKTLDPTWYAQESEAYRTVIEVFDAAIRQIQRETSDARYWEAGLNLDRGNLGITPQSQLEILNAFKREALVQLGELADQARRNNIPPAALR